MVPRQARLRGGADDLRGHRHAVCPGPCVGEIGEVLLRAFRRGAIPVEDVRCANDIVARRIAMRSPFRLVDRATTVAVEAAVSFHDALYVAAADVWSLDLITADARLVAKLAPTPWKRRVRLLVS